MSLEENVNAVDGQHPDKTVEHTGHGTGQPGEAKDHAAQPPQKRGGRKKKKEEQKPTILGAVTDQSGRRRSKYHGRGRLNNPTYLPDSMRSEAENLLENGATFKEATEWLNEHHKPEKEGDPDGVTLAAITEYFRSNYSLQRRRVRRMQRMAQELKKALKGEPGSAMAELADAVFFTGVMGLTRGGESLSVKDAVRFHLEREKLGLKEKQLAQQLRNKVDGLRQTLAGEGGHLSAEALRKIKEIYGLIDQSVIASGATRGQGGPAHA